MTGDGGGPPILTLGRYAVYEEIAAGGMATVHFGRLIGPAGFAKTVAVKRLHPQFAKDAEFVAMFLDEARLAARISHPNVVPTLDVVASGGEVLLVMQYIHGESLARLLKALAGPLDPKLATTIVSGVLHGLHAAHTAKSDRGEPLGLVHRDVSPQNVIVGLDGVARLVDFGVAKAADRAQTTRDGQIKGKFSYMAPEQLMSEAVSPRTDVFAASVVLWEALTGRRLFKGDSAARVVAQILSGSAPPPSSVVPGLPKALDACVMRGLSHDPGKRFASAEEMALELEWILPLVSPHAVGKWVGSLAGQVLQNRNDRIGAIEKSSSSASQIPSDGLRVIEEARQRGGSLPDTLVATPGDGSGLSTISVERALSQRPRRQSRSWIMGGAIGALLLGAAGWYAFALRRAPTEPALAASAVPLPATTESAPPSATATPATAPTPSSTASAEPPAPEAATSSDAGVPPATPKTQRRSTGPAKHKGGSDVDLMDVRK